MLKRTPLFSSHQQLGGKLIEFGGWEMPVQYTSITEEHLAVRQAAGLFDICHMGEVRITGPAARDFLNGLLTNDLARLEVGQGQYTLMCNEQGGTIDDLYAYRVGPEEFLLVINASRIEPDLAWLQDRHQAFARRDDARLEHLSNDYGALALQGPRSAQIIDLAFPGPSHSITVVGKASDLKKNQIAQYIWEKTPFYVACTGYSGEHGYEVVAPASLIEALWNRILSVGGPLGLKPAGLGARDTLRTEMGYPLYGHELDEQTSPIEAGVGFFVALDKPDFVGRAVLTDQKARGPAKKLVAFEMAEKSAPPRPHYTIWSTGPDARQIGQVVSGTQSPSLNRGIGLGYVPPEFAKVQTPLEIEIRGRRFAAITVPKPIYRKPA